MELRTSDVMNIVNNNHAKVREQQQMNDYLAEKNRYVKKITNSRKNKKKCCYVRNWCSFRCSTNSFSN